MSGPQLIVSYVEMIPPRVRGALYLSGFVLPMMAGYLVLRGWAGEPELWLASSWSSLTNAIAGAQVVAGHVAKRRRPPARDDEAGAGRLPGGPPDLAVIVVLAVLVVLLALMGVVTIRALDL